MLRRIRRRMDREMRRFLLVALLIATAHQRGAARFPVPAGGGGGYSALNAPSTEVYNPNPSGFLYDSPAVFLDSRYDPGGVALTWAFEVTLSPTGNVATDTATLQGHIDNAATRVGHTRIKLANNFIANQIRLKNNLLGSYWLYIEWTGIGAAQSEGTQANKSTVATTHASAPIIQDAGGIGEPAVRCNLSTHHVRLVGIHFRSTSGALCYNLVQLAGSVGTDDFSVVTDVTKCPRWIIVDRCWLDGGNVSRVRNGIQADTREFCCVDTVINGCYATGNESHGIVGFNGPGPWKVVGCAIEAGSINLLVGGSDPLITGLQTSDLEIRRCYFYKRASWNPNDGGAWDGIGKTCKNLLELKWGDRVLVEGCVFDGNYYDGGQFGSFLVWKTENSGGGNTTVRTKNVTYRHNLARNVSGGYEFIGIGVGSSVAASTSRIHHYNNLVYELAANRLTEAVNSSKALHFSTGANQIVIDHDTIVLSQTESTSRFSKPITFQGNYDHGIKVNNCILAIPIASPPNDADARMIFGDGTRTVSPDTGTNTLAVFCPSPGVGGYEFIDNGVVRTYAAQVNPTTSEYVTTVAAVGFTNVGALDFSLTGGSPFKGICADGSDPGCNRTLLDLATSGVAS
jgi:hypothetical protein